MKEDVLVNAPELCSKVVTCNWTGHSLFQVPGQEYGGEEERCDHSMAEYLLNRRKVTIPSKKKRGRSGVNMVPTAI